MKVTREQIAERFMDEAERAIVFLNAVKMFCNQVITEEHIKEEIANNGGYRGDGANDPDNIPQKRSELLYKNLVVPAEEAVTDKNHFVEFQLNIPALLKDMLNDPKKWAEPLSLLEYMERVTNSEEEDDEDEQDCDHNCEDCEKNPFRTEKSDEDDENTKAEAFSEFLKFLLSLR